MDLFDFTFSKGDIFKRNYKEIEKYIQCNFKQKVKLEWSPKLNIQIMIDRGSELLNKNLRQLNKVFSQFLYVQVCSSPTVYKHVLLEVRYSIDKRVWTVTDVNHKPFSNIH